VRIIHRITFSTIQPADVPAREMQQLAYAAAFLTAVTPPFYLSDVDKDRCCIVGLWYTVKLTASSAVAVSFGSRSRRQLRRPSPRRSSCAVHTRHNRPTYTTVSNFATHKYVDAVRGVRQRECDRPLFCCPHCSLEQQPAGLKQTGLVVTLAVKFEMRIIHRIMNFCITATLKTEGAYYTQVHIISETLR